MSSPMPTLDLVPAALRGDLQRQWEAFGATPEGAAVLARLCGTRLGELARVWAASEFVARSCIQSPAMLEDLVCSGDLASSSAPGGCAARLREQLEAVRDEAGLGAVLRRFRRREMVRIAWRDLAGLADVEECLEDLTALADACVDGALGWLHAEQSRRSGVPRDAEGRAQQLVVLGMGKLGGRELNYSSDIDLIFAYPSAGETDAARPIDNATYFLRLGQRLIAALNTPTADGFVFRVDMRLRPFGDSGPLVLTFDALEAYYQAQGRDWERYAMIKARPIAGDLQAGARLMLALRPFVYRRYLDFGAFESLRGMKAMIAREVARKGMEGNVKLGAGGIREIEFIGQAFQLIYGGRDPALRRRSILAVLAYLGDIQRLPQRAAVALRRAYLYLRRVENRLQAWADQQTHALPEEPLARQRLAFAMGYADWATFERELRVHRQEVEAAFAAVFEAGPAEVAASDGARELVAACTAEGDDGALRAGLVAQGFADPDRVLAALAQLRASYSYRAMRQIGRERMDRLLPSLLAAALRVPQPEVTLERVARLLEGIARRSVYLSLLSESPVALGQLLRLCSSSPWIAEYLVRYPVLLDELLDPAALYAPLDRAGLVDQLQRELQRVPGDDQELVMDALRHFKHAAVLRVAAADVSGAMPLMIVSDHLTEIAETILRDVLARTWAELTARHGAPEYTDGDGVRRTAGFAIVAYGKLGGLELGYGSDLDLVFLHDSRGADQVTAGPRQLDNASFFARLAQRLIHVLTTHTAGGVLYEVDTRLRPSGRSGLLVASLEAFAEYQRSQAWTWEHQALVRARVVAGDPGLAEGFDAVRKSTLCRARDVEALREEVVAMRERMRAELGAVTDQRFHLKQGHGGIADVEFMVQYGVLAGASRHPDLVTYSDNIRQLDALEAAGLLAHGEAEALREAYRRLRRQGHLQKLQEQSSLIDDAELRPEREAVCAVWRSVMETDRVARALAG